MNNEQQQQPKGQEKKNTRLAKKALSESEDNFHALFHSLDDGFAIIELIYNQGALADFYYIETNPAFIRHAGLDPKGRYRSELGLDWKDFLLEQYTRVLETGQSGHFEYSISQLDNRWLQVTASRIGTADSRLIGVVFRDITGRKRTEANLVFLEKVSQHLVALTDINEIMEQLGRKIAAYFDASWCMYTEMGGDDKVLVTAYGWNEANAPSLAGTYHINDFQTEAQQAKNNAGELHACHNTQTDLIVNAENYGRLGIQSFITIPLARNGQCQFLISVIDSKPRQWRTDETDLLRELATRIWAKIEQARAGQALRESEAWYRALFDSVDEGVCMLERLPIRADGRRDYLYLATNIAMQVIFNVPDLTGTTIRDKFPYEEEAWYDDFDRVLETGCPCRFVRETVPQGLVLKLFVTRLEHSNGKQLLVVIQDITARKRLEKQKDEFIAVASHELRTPVTSIKAYTQLLEELFAENGDLQSAALMQTLEVQVDRLTVLINALLDTTRITEGKLKLQKTSFAMDALIADTTKTLQQIAGRHRIVLQLDAALPIHADQERIRQVLINLIGNAIKYSPGADTVIVSSAIVGSEIQVCVQDFGIGMTEEAQRQIFEQFYRSSEASTFPGLGLGLYISANIIREHDGCIWVESQPGQGALFCFMLPLVRR